MIREDWSFIYLITGEVLTDVEGNPYLLRGQDCALIPPQLAYSVKYFKDSIGYMGAFSSRLLRNSAHRMLRFRTPNVMTIPMEDKVFFDELMIRMSRFSEDFPTVQGLLEVLLGQFDSAIPQNNGTASVRLSSAYLGRVFDTSRPFSGVSGYAGELGVTPNHQNRVVKSETGRSAENGSKTQDSRWPEPFCTIRTSQFRKCPTDSVSRIPPTSHVSSENWSGCHRLTSEACKLSFFKRGVPVPAGHGDPHASRALSG